MLAPNKSVKPEQLTYPMLASVKMDGIRCLIMNGTLISRSGKECPNRHLRKRMKPLIDFCEEKKIVIDGEIWSPTANFQQIFGAWSSYNDNACNELDLKLHAFDCLTHMEWQTEASSEPYLHRHDRLFGCCVFMDTFNRVPQQTVQSSKQLIEYYNRVLEEGHEGLIVRDAYGRYKWGRCTFREGNMFKMKAEEELDCVVVGFEEKQVMANGIERDYDELGRPKTINRVGDKVGANTLGSLIVQADDSRVFCVGAGFNDNHRKNIWDKREKFIGQWCKVKYAVCGEKNLPRFPIFLSWRDPK